MIVIFIVALVLFGPKKLPELGRTVGKLLTQFRHVSSDLKASFEREMQNLERETEAAKLKELGASTVQQIESHTADFEYPYYDSGSSQEPYDYTAAMNPPLVSASEVQGAELQIESHHAPETTPAMVEAVTPHVEGTVAREAQVDTHVEAQHETPQHN
jgi:TatA/E family protein of Tat protein translocase